MLKKKSLEFTYILFVYFIQDNIYLQKYSRMKNLFIAFLFLFGIAFVSAQISVTDTISGGSYKIEANPVIDSLVQKTVAIKCYKPPVDEGKKSGESLDPCANNQKVMGYKIQIMYTKNRESASKTRNEFARSYSYLVPELIYTRPDYRVMAGDYFTKRSAAMDLAAVKKKYPGAFLVQWRVWCRKAK